ncbi:MAG: VOC family protein [Thermoleophilia bacterium]
MDPVVHFEMPYDDAQRAVRFYREAFGWQMQVLGEEMGRYVLATTIETDEGGPKRPGAINGGLYQRDPAAPPQAPSFVIAVDDVEIAARKVKEAGGTVLAEPMTIQGIGLYAAFVDPEGNRLSLLQPVPRTGRASAEEEGAS